MAYDIPDEIKYSEKIVANLDMKQLGYAILFGILAILSYNKDLDGNLAFIPPSFFVIFGIGFIFFKADEFLFDVISYYIGLRSAPYNSIVAQKFFGVNEIKDNLVFTDDKIISIIQVEPINIALMDESRKKALLENYKSFLNHLSTAVQILARTVPQDVSEYFSSFKVPETKDLLELYEDFKSFEYALLEKHTVKKAIFYLLIPYQKDTELSAKELEEKTKIAQEKLLECGLRNKRLENKELRNLYLSYASLSGEKETTEKKLKEEEKSSDVFRTIITPSFEMLPDHAMINDEYHKVVKITGYPRKVEEGWLQMFLTRNEGYDISMHITPSSIASILVHLHNQIIHQTADLMLSTAKGTPNPALEIKKADTMNIYNSLYKGEEKLFGVSLYVDNKDTSPELLNLLTEKCRSNLNSMLMIPAPVKWRTADAIKSTMPIASDKLTASRDFLTSSLAATFPFISPTDSGTDGVLFGHELDTMNPIFVDFKSMSNKHFFVIGISGSGKSYTSKYLAMQQLFREEMKVYILDPNGEYSSLCTRLGGKVVELSKDSDSIINIFDIGSHDFGSKMLSLISAFDIIVGGITESQKAVLNHALLLVYETKGIIYNDPKTWKLDAPTFSDLRDVLLELHKEYKGAKNFAYDKSTDVLLNRVAMYCENGFFGFLDKHTRIDTTNDIICFDLSMLPNAVKSLLMFAVLDLISNRVRKDNKPKLVMIDEGWSLLKSNEAASYILEFVKTSRKFNASIGFITQEIEDLINSNAGKSILNTCSTKVLMRQSPSNIDLIAKNLGLNTLEKNYLISVQKGHGLLITEDAHYKFATIASEKLHELITTDPAETKKKTKKKSRKKAEKKQVKKKIKLDLKKGVYLREELASEQVLYLLKSGYSTHPDRMKGSGNFVDYLVKKDEHESSKHAFMVWKTVEELRKYFKNIKTFSTGGPDIVVKTKKGQTCFEIETGTFIGKNSVDTVSDRFSKLKKEYLYVYVIVPNVGTMRKYTHFAESITQLQMPGAIKRMGKRET